MNTTIVCPNFIVLEIKGVVNPRKMAVVLDDSMRVEWNAESAEGSFDIVLSFTRS